MGDLSLPDLEIPRKKVFADGQPQDTIKAMFPPCFCSSKPTLFYFLPPIPLAQMCDLCCKRYNGRGGCGHTIAYDYQKCVEAMRRPDRKPCVPPSGNMRDLPRVVDIQDDHLDGLCESCRGETPPSSQGSQFMEVIG